MLHFPEGWDQQLERLDALWRLNAKNKTMLPVFSLPHSRSPAPWRGSCPKIRIQFGGCVVLQFFIEAKENTVCSWQGWTVKYICRFIPQTTGMKEKIWVGKVNRHPLCGRMLWIHTSFVFLSRLFISPIFFSRWLYQGHYFGFISLCAFSPVFLSLLLIYHIKTYAIVWDLYVEFPDTHSQKYFCLTDLNKYNSGVCSSLWDFAVMFKGHQLGILFQDVAKYLQLDQVFCRQRKPNKPSFKYLNINIYTNILKLISIVN